jgi:hypothetical protein
MTGGAKLRANQCQIPRRFTRGEPNRAPVYPIKRRWGQNEVSHDTTDRGMRERSP